MKKILASFLAIVMLISLAGCGTASKPETTVIKFCDSLKSFDTETISSCFVSGNSDINSSLAVENEDDQYVFTK